MILASAGGAHRAGRPELAFSRTSWVTTVTPDTTDEATAQVALTAQGPAPFALNLAGKSARLLAANAALRHVSPPAPQRSRNLP